MSSWRVTIMYQVAGRPSRHIELAIHFPHEFVEWWGISEEHFVEEVKEQFFDCFGLVDLVEAGGTDIDTKPLVVGKERRGLAVEDLVLEYLDKDHPRNDRVISVKLRRKVRGRWVWRTEDEVLKDLCLEASFFAR